MKNWKNHRPMDWPRLARRTILRTLAVTPLAGCVSPNSNAQTGKSVKTPAETEGPFFPIAWNGDIDGNLVQTASAVQYEQGTLLTITGRILRPDGSPAAGAQVAIWQCDAKGRYRHPRDAGEEPLRDGFQGYGRVNCTSQGEYEFKTVKPIAYASRPPHVHFRIDDGKTRLSTQMYFDGQNKERGPMGNFTGWAKDRTLLTVRPMATTAGAMTARFDIYL